MNPFTISGGNGQLRTGIRLAAVLTDWKAECTQDTLGAVSISVSARVRDLDVFYITQGITSIGLMLNESPESWWMWSNVQVLTNRASIVIGRRIELVMRGDPVIKERMVHT